MKQHISTIFYLFEIRWKMGGNKYGQIGQSEAFTHDFKMYLNKRYVKQLLEK